MKHLWIWKLALVSASIIATAGPAIAQARVNAALLPASRYVQIGDTATAFVTMQNTGDQTAVDCGFSPVTSVAATFSSFTTDPATNLNITPEQTTANIPVGGLQTYGFAFTTTGAISPTDIEFDFDCTNTDPARSISGVNTFILGASNDGGPDIVALAATIASDGITRTPGPYGTGVFSVATANVGGAGPITLTPVMTDQTISITLRICETNPATGACQSPPSQTVTTTADAGGTNSFGVFARGSGVAELAPARRRVQLRITNGGGILRGLTSVAFTTQSEVAAEGGRLLFEDAEVNVDESAAWAPVDVTMSGSAGPPATLPAGTNGAERTRDIGVSDEDRLNAPLTMWLNYDDTGLNEDEIFVLHYNSVSGQYEAVTILDVDTIRNRIRIDSRNFSFFVTTSAGASILPAAFSVSGFDPATDGWNIANFGSYFAPGGNCLGMSAYAIWYHGARPTQTLSTQFSNAGGAPTSIAHLTAARAHLAQSQTWAIRDYYDMAAMTDVRNIYLMKVMMFLTDEPLILVHGTDGRPAHATVLYGWDAAGLLHYEVNTAPGATRSATVPITNNTYGTYGSYNDFAFVGLPSLGRSENFLNLTAQAEGGFTRSANMNITVPAQNATIDARFTTMRVTTSGDLDANSRVIAYVNGATPTEFRRDTTDFFASLPLRNGENTVILVGGVPRGNFSLWTRDAATLIWSATGTRDASDFRATLNWTHVGDVDLYVTEPSGTTAWYASQNTPNGLQLDFDNTSGYGPENTTVGEDAGDIVEAGEYRIGLHYYRGVAPASGTIQILLNEAESNQLSRTFNFTINSNGDPATRGPDGTGSQWACCIFADPQSNTIR